MEPIEDAVAAVYKEMADNGALDEKSEETSSMATALGVETCLFQSLKAVLVVMPARWYVLLKQYIWGTNISSLIQKNVQNAKATMLTRNVPAFVR